MLAILIFALVVLGLMMATTLTEGKHASESLISEAPGNRSRASITVASGAGEVGACTVLGKIKFGAISQAFSGTGNGAMGTLTRQATNCVVGDWKVRCTLAITNSGRFEVIDPNGVSHGDALVGSAFANGIGFTIADGGTDFVVGDTFTVTVAAGSGKYSPIDTAAVTGIQNAAAICFEAIDATSADVEVAAFVRDCELLEDSIDWDDLDAGEITTAKAELAELGIIIREAI